MKGTFNEITNENLRYDIEQVVKTYQMDSNGYAYFNDDNFNLKNNKPCYIPENAETVDDVYSYKDLVEEVKKWLETNEAKDYIKENGNGGQTTESWVERLYSDLEWQFPSTRLADYTY